MSDRHPPQPATPEPWKETGPFDDFGPSPGAQDALDDARYGGYFDDGDDDFECED